MENSNYQDLQGENLGAINATLRRHTYALERIAKALENIEFQGTEQQEAN